MSTRYRVYIRNGSYQRVGELTDWKSLTVIPAFNDVGTWSLVTSSETPEIALLTKSGGIIVTREVDGTVTTVFSGFVWTEYGYTATEFRASGYSDEALLWTPARPTPHLAGPPFSDAYDVRTGAASTIMRTLVDINIGPTAPSPWKIDALILADDIETGSSITSRANLQPLLTLLAELAITPYAGGLGFYLRQSDDVDNVNKIEFAVYVPPDKSEDAKFSIEIGTISEYEDIAQAPEANHVYVLGGDAFGENRTIIAEQDNDSITEWGRVISTVIDRRGTTDSGELNQQAAEAIAGVNTLRRTAVTPFDVPSLQYGVDYDLGTLVTIVTSGGEVVDLIRRVEINLDPERGAVVTPIVGQGDGSDEERTATIVRTIQGRLSNVERNWTVPDSSITRDMLATVLKPPIGEVKWLAGSEAPTGYLLCWGQSVSRTTYSALFAVIGTTWGVGDGSTTFGVPDLRDRSPVGSGSTFALGATGGNASIDFAHTHTTPAHAHAHTHSTPAHAHAHTHSTPDHAHSHVHSFNHAHNVDIDHDHAGFSSGLQAGEVVAVGAAAPAAGTWDHRHTIDVPALGFTSRTTGGPGSTDTNSALDSASSGSGTSGSALDSASSGSGTSGSALDTASSGSGTSGSSLTSTNIRNPYAALTPVIYAGV